MFGLEILEVAIGLILVFFLVSIVCTAVREGIESLTKTRAAYLEQGIRELLHDLDGKGLAGELYRHPLIHGLYSDDYQPERPARWLKSIPRGGRLPSYIPDGNFALALMDIVARGPVVDTNSPPDSAVLSFDTIRRNVLQIENLQVQRALLPIIDSAEGDLNRVRAGLEAWFNSSMDRVSGWYKRLSQWIIFWVALAAAATLNVNTLTIAEYLYRDDIARAAIIARAGVVSADSSFVEWNYRTARAELDQLALPIGWGQGGDRPAGDEALTGARVWDRFLQPVLGWLLTAFAATLGAPFWFDLLNKVMVIRSTVKPREKSQEEGSEDRR